jgi:hypothetical protein
MGLIAAFLSAAAAWGRGREKQHVSCIRPSRERAEQHDCSKQDSHVSTEMDALICYCLPSVMQLPAAAAEASGGCL